MRKRMRRGREKEEEEKEEEEEEEEEEETAAEPGRWRGRLKRNLAQTKQNHSQTRQIARTS